MTSPPSENERLTPTPQSELAACGQRRAEIHNDTPLQPQSERSKRRRQWVGLHENHAGVKLP